MKNAICVLWGILSMFGVWMTYLFDLGKGNLEGVAFLSWISFVFACIFIVISIIIDNVKNW